MGKYLNNMAVGGPGKGTERRSSLPYQVLLIFNGYYFVLFTLAELLLYIFKGVTLPFPNGAIAAEVILVLLLAGMEAIRLFFGQKGNLTEKMGPVAISLALSIPSILGCL